MIGFYLLLITRFEHIEVLKIFPVIITCLWITTFVFIFRFINKYEEIKSLHKLNIKDLEKPFRVVKINGPFVEIKQKGKNSIWFWETTKRNRIFLSIKIEENKKYFFMKEWSAYDSKNEWFLKPISIYMESKEKELEELIEG